MSEHPALRVLGRLALVGTVAALIVWSFAGLRFDFTHTGTGVLRAGEFIAAMFPHKRADWSYDRALAQTRAAV